MVGSIQVNICLEKSQLVLQLIFKFKIGDLAVLHSNGRVELKDRSKDIIISGGENISSIEVENAIITHTEVSEVAVVALPHEQWGEVPCCFVVRTPGSSLSAEGVVVWSRRLLAGFKVPKRVVFIDALPKTVTGKIQKHILRKELEAGGKYANH